MKSNTSFEKQTRPSTILKRLQEQRKELENILNVRSDVFNKVDPRYNYASCEYTKGVKSDIVELFRIQNTPYNIGFSYYNVFDKEKSYVVVSLTKKLSNENLDFVSSSLYGYEDFKSKLKSFNATLKSVTKTELKSSIVKLYNKTFKQDKEARVLLKEKCSDSIKNIETKDITASISEISGSMEGTKERVEMISSDISDLKKSLGINELENLLEEKYKVLQTQIKDKITYLNNELIKNDTIMNTFNSNLNERSMKLSSIVSSYPLVVNELEKEIKSSQSFFRGVSTQSNGLNNANKILKNRFEELKESIRL